MWIIAWLFVNARDFYRLCQFISPFNFWLSELESGKRVVSKIAPKQEAADVAIRLRLVSVPSGPESRTPGQRLAIRGSFVSAAISDGLIETVRSPHLKCVKETHAASVPVGFVRYKPRLGLKIRLLFAN